MRRTVAIVLFGLLTALCAVVIASAQEATVEVPTLPADATAEVTATLVPSTAEATEAPTSQAQPTPSAPSTEEATAEAPVAPETTQTPVSGAGFVRVAYFAPGDQMVDVYIDDVLFFKGLKFPSVSKWVALEPGSHNIAVVESGQPSNSSLTAPLDLSVSAGSWQTVAVVGSETGSTLSTAVIAEDYEDLLPSTGGFTFFNALPGSAPINLVRDDVVYFAQIGFPSPDTKASSSSLRGDSGTFDVKAVDPNDPSHVFAEQSSLKLPENAYALVALVGPASNPRLYELVTDRSEVEMLQGTLPEPGKLMDALRANDNLTSFADALQSAGLAALLTGDTPYTIFAPANFVVDNAMSADQQANVLRGYIVPGKFTSQDLINAKTLTALNGDTLTVTTDNDGILVNGVRLIDVNVPAVNGVIHMLNGLLTQ